MFTPTATVVPNPNPLLSLKVSRENSHFIAMLRNKTIIISMVQKCKRRVNWPAGAWQLLLRKQTQRVGAGGRRWGQSQAAAWASGDSTIERRLKTHLLPTTAGPLWGKLYLKPLFKRE